MAFLPLPFSPTSFRWGEELATGNTCAHQTESFLSPFLSPSLTSFLSSLLLFPLCHQTFAALLAPLAYFSVIFLFPLVFLHVFSCSCLRPIKSCGFLPLYLLPYRLLSLPPVFVARFIHQSPSAPGSRAAFPPSNLLGLTSFFHLRLCF